MRKLIVALAVCCALATSALAQDVPGLKRDRKFDELVMMLNLEETGLEFTYKKGKHDGSSVGFHVSQLDRRRSGTFVPYNSSSDPEAEVVSYRLARFLGVSDIYNPVSYFTIGPLAAARFSALLKKRTEIYHDRKLNYLRITTQLKSNPNSLFGIYRFRPKGKKYVVTSLGSNGEFNLGSQLAAFIRANGPMPSENRIALPGVKGQRPGDPVPLEAESELARQLSVIFTIDQLMGQWDRFWRNLEAMGDGSARLRLLARDNGGANVDDGWEWHARYERWVSRYDRDVMQKLQALDAFLHGSKPNFAGYSNVEQWKTAAGFIKASSFNTFKRKLHMLIDKRLPMLEKQFGPKMYFAAKAAGGAPLE